MKKRKLHNDVEILERVEEDYDENDDKVLFDRLPVEEEDFQVERRRLLCNKTWKSLRRLVKQELNTNSYVLLGMVKWLLEHSNKKDKVGERIPAAVMLSHMGSNVDRKVYHPQVQSFLREAEPLPSIVVLIPSGECHSFAEAMGHVGTSIWGAYQEAKKNRGQRKVALEAPPKTLNTLQMICSIAREWLDLVGLAQGKVHIMLMMQDIVMFDKDVLESVFRCLAEAQHKEMWCGQYVSFSVVLWASKEMQLQATMLENLYLTSFPFIDPAKMLNNILLAILIEPTLPFDLPYQTYIWITSHFKKASHSLQWLLHVLQGIIFTHFYTQSGSLMLDLGPDFHTHRNADAMLEKLAPLLQSHAVRERGGAVKYVRACMDKWNKYRQQRCDGFIVLWRFLNVLEGKKNVLDCYGEYLVSCERSNVGFEEYMADILQSVRRTLLGLNRGRELQQEDVVLQLFEAFEKELHEMVHEKNTEAISELLMECERILKECKEKKEEEIKVSLGKQEEQQKQVLVSKKPKDQLLMKKRSSSLNRVFGNSGLKAVQVVEKTQVDGNHKLISGITECLTLVMKKCLQPPSRADYPLIDFCCYRQLDKAEKTRQLSLFGPTKEEIISCYDTQHLDCECCEEDARKNGKSLATMEDINIGFDFVKKSNKTFKAEDWVSFFQDVCQDEYEDAEMEEQEVVKSIQKRFKDTLRHMQWTGFIEYNARENRIKKNF